MKQLQAVAALAVALCACEFDILPETGGAPKSADPESEFVSAWAPAGTTLQADAGSTGASAPVGKCVGTYTGNVIINGTTPLPVAFAGKCEIQGSVTVSGLASDGHLEALAAITRIGGQLSVSTMKLSALNGLRSLTYVGAILQIDNCGALQSTNGLGQLKEVAQGLLISNNGALSSLALPLLQTVGGTVSIENNQKLATVSMPALASVKQDLRIRGAVALTNLNPFAALTLVTSTIELKNTGLTNFNAFPNLASLQGIEVSQNLKLQSFAFAALQSLNNLQLANNPVLTVLQAAFPKLAFCKGADICNNPSLPPNEKLAFMQKFNATPNANCTN